MDCETVFMGLGACIAVVTAGVLIYRAWNYGRKNR